MSNVRRWGEHQWKESSEKEELCILSTQSHSLESGSEREHCPLCINGFVILLHLEHSSHERDHFPLDQDGRGSGKPQDVMRSYVNSAKENCLLDLDRCLSS